MVNVLEYYFKPYKNDKMKTTNYQQAKSQLKHASKVIKKDFGTDKPAIRMHINDTCDTICKDYYRLTEYQQNLLHNYACTLHP